MEFAGNHTVLVFALVTSFFLVVFSELRRKASAVLNIDATDAVKLINDDATIIDLRSADAYNNGHIVGAKNIPFDELESRLDKLSGQKAKPILTVCDAGINSTKATNVLQTAGFESAFGLKGGMTAWTQAGMPVVTSKKTKGKK